MGGHKLGRMGHRTDLVFLIMNDINFDGPYFFRTSDGNEIDLIVILSGKIFALEIKLSSSPGRDDMERLKKATDLIGDCQKIIISRVPHPTESPGFLSTKPI